MSLFWKLYFLRLGAWLAIAGTMYTALLQLLGGWSLANAAAFVGLLCLLVVLYRFALRFVRAHHEEPA